MTTIAGQDVLGDAKRHVVTMAHGRRYCYDARMAELVSEPIAPHAGTFDAASMGTGGPGLPTGFTWRDRSYDIVDIQSAWKESSREGSHAQGELYLRRHYYTLKMDDDSVWTVYFIRQTPRTGNPKKRWFLYTVDTPS